MVGTMMTGCANDDVTIEAPQPENPNKTVTMTMTISREGGDGATTRALTAEGHKTFEAGDQIAIIYKNTSGETVKVLSETLQDNGDITNSGKKARFTVTLTDPAADGAVRYIYPAAMAAATVATSSDVNADANVNYAALATQDGTLASLATNLDLSIFDGNLSGTQLPASVTLYNQLAILELTVKNASGSSVNGSVTKLSVFDGTNVYKIIDRSAVAEPIYVALRPVASDKTIHFCATDGTTNYRKSVVLENNPLERNNIYPVNLSTTETTGIALEFLTGNYEAQNGDILSGILLGKYAISTASTAANGTAITVTLDGVDINHHYPISIHAPGINCQGNINLVLVDGSVNYITASTGGYAGVFIKGDRTLTISGNGSLTATGKGNSSSSSGGAGIGGGRDSSYDGGNIVIAGGTINAQGGWGGAGIGNGTHNSDRKCGYITISNGNVTAKGGYFAAGIGTGYANDNQNQCGSITISGGTVTASGGPKAAGIGGGYVNGNKDKSRVSCGTITIGNTVTLVTAMWGTGGTHSIGKGDKNIGTQSCGTITIGGTVYWDGSSYQNGGGTYLKTSPLEYKPQH